MPEEIAPFHRKKEGFTLSDGCLLWGKRVIVPQKLQPQLLAELHFGHVGICCMKSLAWSFVWWPGLDDAIEKLTKDCDPCKVTAVMPAAVTHGSIPVLLGKGCTLTMVNGITTISSYLSMHSVSGQR